MNMQKTKEVLYMPRNCLYHKILFISLIAVISSPWSFTTVLAQDQKDAAVVEEVQPKSLYERLGGYDAISSVIDDFFKRMIPDKQLGRFFLGLSTDSKTKVQQHTVDFVCKVTGGPCAYTGRDMKTVHTGLNITESDWDLSAKYLTQTLDKFQVPDQEKAEVLNLVTSLKPAIVGQ
jgi:hemoglobin